MHGRAVALATLVMVGTVSLGALLAFTVYGVVPSIASGPVFNYVVNIWMENKNYASVLAGNSCCPYENQLANSYSTETNYGSITSPSLPDYLGFLAGSYPSCASNDGDPTSCNAGTQTNLIDRFDSAGLSWQAYAENYPVTQGCTSAGTSAPWYARHFPFNYYSDITNNPARCAKLHLTTAASADNEFLAALNNSTLPNFVWLTPNGCNDTHDCGAGTGDNYLATLVPKILSSNMFATGKALLVITWDEYSPAPNIEAGPMVKTAYRGTTIYNHYNWLKTLESNWNLPTLTSNDANALAMADLFTAGTSPDFSLTSNPSSTSFTVGTSGSSTITLNSLGGFTGTVPLTIVAPSGISANCTPNPIATTSTCSFTAASPASGTVTITGTSGTLTHTTTISVTANTVVTGNLTPSQWTLTYPSPNTETFTNGALTQTVIDTNSGYSGAFYATALYGAGAGQWTCGTPCITGSTSFSTTVNMGPVTTTGSSWTWHIYIGVYYLFPSAVTGTAGGATYTTNELDGQIQIQHCDSSISAGCALPGYYTSNLGNRFGYREELSQQTSGTYPISNFDLNGFCQRAIPRLSITGNPSCSLVRLELGVEAYGVNPAQATWTSFTANTVPPPPNPPTVAFTTSANPTVGSPVTFTATGSSGTPPYSFAWNFGDMISGTGATTTHTYATSGTFSVTATITDSASQTGSQTQQLTLAPGSCTNGATNPPTCTICPAGQTIVNGICTTVQTCTNGATNPPACNTCPSGMVMVNGVCAVQAILPAFVVPALAVTSIASFGGVGGLVLAKPRRSGK